MAGTLAASQLSAGPATTVRFEVATEADDAELRRLLRESPMRGRITLSFEREPDYFAEEDNTERETGSTRQTIVAREAGRIIAAGSCALRRRFVNGRPCRVGYLGGLRLDQRKAGRFDVLRRGYQFFAQLQRKMAADYYFTSIAADNARAVRFLERGLPGMPRYDLVSDFITLLIRVPKNASARLVPARFEIAHITDLDEVLTYLNQPSAQYQFAPCWSAAEVLALARLGLGLNDFRIVRRGRAIVGCAALWDQRSFKQTVIRAYSGILERARPYLNLGARLSGMPGLPPTGTILAQAIVSHLAVSPTEPDILTGLLQSLFPLAQQKGIDFLTVGLAANDPRLAVLRKHFASRTYRSRLYAVRWPGSDGLSQGLEARLPFPDVALL